MTIRATSREAYETVDLGKRQAEVLNAIQEIGPCTDVEIAGALGWPINRITPRRGELLAANLIEECGTKRGPTGRSATVWRIAQPKAPAVYREQGALFA